jgi:hypothetical protein
LIGMAIDNMSAMHRSPTRDDCSLFIGKKLLEVTFDEDRTRLRFEDGARLDVAGELEHRMASDILGRAAPHEGVIPSLMQLVGMTVRQVGVEPAGLLLAFADGHEVRVLAEAGRPGFEVMSR